MKPGQLCRWCVLNPFLYDIDPDGTVTFTGWLDDVNVLCPLFALRIVTGQVLKESNPHWRSLTSTFVVLLTPTGRTIVQNVYDVVPLE